MNIKLVITDIDGVWTDAGMYYDNQNNEFKKFNTYDSAGVLFLKNANIPVAIITGEKTQIVKRRAEKLGIELLFQGVSDKWSVVIGLAQKMNLQLNEIAYIGDDLNDWKCLQKLTYTATPSSAPEYIKSTAKWVLNKKGGEGVFREFAEKLLIEMGLFSSILNTFND